MVGFAVGAFYAPLTSTATKWFTARRGLAVALVSSGIGVGILAIAPLARALTSLWDWRVALLVIGDLAWLIIVPVALVIREQPGDMGAAAMGGVARAGREYTTREVAGRAAVLGHRPHALRVLRRPLGADLPHGDARHRPGHRRHGGRDGARRVRPVVDRRAGSAAACWPIASGSSRRCWPASRCRRR